MRHKKKILSRDDLDAWAIEGIESGRQRDRIMVSYEEMASLRNSLGALRAAPDSDRLVVLTVGGPVTVQLEPSFSPKEILLTKTGLGNYIAFGAFVIAIVAVGAGVMAAAFQVQKRIETVFGADQ
jgi:hypothetical protein